MPLAVMLRSAVENCRFPGGIDIRILDGGLGWRARWRVSHSLPPNRATIQFIDVREASLRLASAPVFGHVSLATYYRFLIPDVVPDPKCVYVDADTVVLGDLTQLWDEPTRDSHVLAVQQGTFGSMQTGMPGSRAPDDLDRPYFNAGVMVMDLDRWRLNNPVPALMDYLVRNAHNVRCWDQDALNVVLAGCWGPLQAKWNTIVDCSQPIAEAPAAVLSRLREAGIIHFASATKPWHYYVNHPSREVFFAPLDRTQWAGWRPKRPLRDCIRSRHWWGQRVRCMPVVGKVWSRLMALRHRAAGAGA